ncbi:hypothetical protein D3C75_508080 [compost metagenome]
MRINPSPQKTETEEIEKVLKLEISKHEKYKDLYTLIQIEQKNRIEIDRLMENLGLCARTGYDYIPMSPSERLNADTKKKTKKKKDDDSEGSTAKPAQQQQPTPSYTIK